MNCNIIRGENRIGGTIIEIEQDATRVLLDCGALLPEPGREPEPDPFDMASLGRPDAIFLSHHHGDHTGLIDRLPEGVPVYASAGTAAVLRAVGEFIRKPARPVEIMRPGEPVRVGALAVTAIPVEHSAADAMMLFVEGGGERILYTGDYRRVPETLGAYLTTPIGLLITEGTLATRPAQRYPDEAAVQSALEDVLRSTKGRVFVLQSAANLPRVHAVLKAVKAACPERVVMQDVFMKYLLGALGKGNLVSPFAFTPFWMDENSAAPDALAYFNELRRRREATGKDSFLKQRDAVVFIRASMLCMLRRLEKDGLDFSKDALVFSMWRGYEQEPKCARLLEFFAERGIEPLYIHTSGHADMGEIERLMRAVRAKKCICVHSEDPEAVLRLTEELS